MGEHLARIGEKSGRESEVLAVIEANRREMEIFARHGAAFGYAFFVARAKEG